MLPRLQLTLAMGAKRASIIVIAPLFLLLASGSCGPSAEGLEAQRVLRTIDVLRDAPTEPLSAREALLTDLTRQQAEGAQAARARDACAKAYRLLLEGSSLQRRVEKQLEVPAGASLDTLRDLASAEAKIKESAAAMPDCDRAAAELRLGQGRSR